MRAREILREYVNLKSPSFKQWFGNSKVVDRKGNPLMVFHGTTQGNELKRFHQFTHFGSSEAASSRVRDLMGWKGSDFMPPSDHEMAKLAPHIYPVYLKIENPLFLPDMGEWFSDEIYNELVKKGIASGTWKEQQKNGYEHASIIQWLRDNTNYDGIAYENMEEDTGHISWIIFDSDQVMSAFG